MRVTNIRYAEDGKIAFDFNGVTIKIKEPMDVILVGVSPDAASRWIVSNYGYMLAQV